MSRQQARKEAVTAARDLLKVDAARVRKAGARRCRRVRRWRCRRVRRLRRLRCGTMRRRLQQDPSPTAASSSTGAPTISSAAPAPAPNHGVNLQILFNVGNKCNTSWRLHKFDPAPQLSQNFIFGGEASQYATFRPTQDEQSKEGYSTPISAKDNSTYVNVDNEEEAPRTEKRIFWTQEEDVRMMSAWLLNSTDSSCGADRKNKQYWSDVEVIYNETTPSHRARNAKQIKDRFHKVNKWTDLFHSAWLKARMGQEEVRAMSPMKW